MADRPLDVVVFGATGFTGEMVARYLAERDPEPGLRWGIAGRSQAKLDAVAERLGRPDLPRIVADSNDRASLDQLVSQTKALCTTVGPYATYGSELVAACIAGHTHYCDLTGEITFMRRMIDAHHEAARDAGVRIVHACGFDSIPADLGVLTLQQAAIEQFGAPFEVVEGLMWAAKGGLSGGTLASALELLTDARDPKVRRLFGNPYSLVPGANGPDTTAQRGIRYSEAAGTWTAPFFMAPVNERVVRRSNAMLDNLYGEDFRYGESLRTGPGLGGRLAGIALLGGYAAGFTVLATPPLRQVAHLLGLPRPGEGPSEDAVERGFFQYRMFGSRPGGKAGPNIVVTVKGRRDPGYGATACMLAESAICLAINPDLPRAGVLTSASAMGKVLAERLNATDVQFAVLADAGASGG